MIWRSSAINILQSEQRCFILISSEEGPTSAWIPGFPSASAMFSRILIGNGLSPAIVTCRIVPKTYSRSIRCTTVNCERE